MFDPKQLDEIARKLAEVLPPGVREMQKDMERNFRAVLQSALNRMDLVTRDEVERLTDMLVRTRGQVDGLEERVARLEGNPPETDAKPPDIT
jgi:BMFP domain-containing protein YqiC